MTAILNRVAESSTSTGTGNFVLGGAYVNKFGPNVRTFANALNGLTLNFYYDIHHDTLSEFEHGIGFLSSGQLVRSLVIRSSNGDAAVNFSAGTKTVMSAVAPDVLALEPLNCNGTTQFRKTFFGRHGDGATGLTANRLYFIPYSNMREIDVTGVAINLTTVSATAGHVARFGLFEHNSNRGYRLVQDFGTVAVDGTAGVRVINTNFRLPVGTHFFGIAAQGGSVTASEPAFWNGWGTGQATNGTCWEYVDGLTVTSAFAASYTTTLAPVVNSPTPTIWLRTATGLFQS